MNNSNYIPFRAEGSKGKHKAKRIKTVRRDKRVNWEDYV